MKRENTKMQLNKIESNVCDCVWFSGVGLLNIHLLPQHPSCAMIFLLISLCVACCEYVCVLSSLHERQTYRNISCEDLAKRCGWKIEWKWKLAHENCKQNSHCSQYIHGLYLKFSPVDCFTVTVIFVFVHVHELLQQFSKHFICMWGSVCMLFIRISLKI